MLHIKKKLNSAEVRRLEKLLTRIENKWKVAFRNFIESATSDEVIRRVADLIEAGQVAAAVDIVEGFVIRLAASVIPPSFSLVGDQKVSQLVKMLSSTMPEVAVAFDPTHPRAAALQQKQQLKFITEFTDEQRAVVNQALTESLQEGTNPLKSARSFRDSIGLTKKQWAAVSNYRRMLREGNLEALTRDIRDRRFDQTVRNAFENGRALTSDQIESMVSQYIKRYHQYRADVIARTESSRTLSEANREATVQTMEQAGFVDNQVKREWNSTDDARTRETHRHMRVREVIGMSTPFVTGGGVAIMYPGDPDTPAEETIQCRCVETQEFIL